MRQHVIVGYNHCDDPVGGVWAEAQIVLPYYCHMLGYCRFLSLWDTRTYWRHRHLRHAWCNLRNHTRIWWIVRRGGSKNQRPTQHVSNSCRRHWFSIYVAQSSFVAALNSIAMSPCIRYHLLSGSTTYVGQIDVVNIRNQNYWYCRSCTQPQNIPLDLKHYQNTCILYWIRASASKFCVVTSYLINQHRPNNRVIFSLAKTSWT